jgi:hypothetical protein
MINKENKFMQFARLFKPIFNYIFLFYLSISLSFGWIMFENKMFDTTQILYLFLMLFMSLMVFLGYAIYTFKTLNDYSIIATILLFVLPVSEARVFIIKFSVVLFCFALLVETFKIAFNFNFNFNEFIVNKINRLFSKK